MGRADGRPVLSPSLVCLPRSLPPARSPLPPSSTAAPSSPGRRRGRRGSGLPQAPAGLESGGWNPPGALNSRAPRCCVSASSWGPGPGGRSGGRGRAGPSGGRARLAGAGGRRGPDGRGRQPDGRAAGAGLRDPLRRSRFPHKLPESGASAALLPASSSPANQQRAPRPAPPISRPALRWPRQPIRPSAPPPGLQPIRTVGRSSQRRGQHEAAAGGGAGSGGAWGEGYGAKGGGGGGFLCRLLGFSPRLQNMSPYPMVTRPWSPNPLAATRAPPPRNLISPPPWPSPLYIPRPPSLQHPVQRTASQGTPPRSPAAAAPRARLREDQLKIKRGQPPFPAERAPDSNERAPTAEKPLPPLPHLSDFPACHVSFPFKQGRSWLGNPSPASLFPLSPLHLPPPTPAPNSPFSEAECGTLIHFQPTAEPGL